ncbi:MAG: hypothetical protein AAFY76_20775, partial [Cyanobacteria bacterium J06649_11]
MISESEKDIYSSEDLQINDIYRYCATKNSDVVTDGGAVMAPNAILRAKNIGFGAKYAYCTLLEISRTNDYCKKGIKDLAIIAGVSAPTMGRWLGELAQQNYVEPVRRGIGQPTTYVLNSYWSKNDHRFEVRDGSNIVLSGADNLTRHGYTIIPNVIMKDRRLKPGEKMAYGILLSYGFGDMEKPQIYQRTIACRLGTTDQVAGNYLRRLDRLGFITIHRQGKMLPNIYELLFRAFPEAEDAKNAKQVGWCSVFADEGYIYDELVTKELGLEEEGRALLCHYDVEKDRVFIRNGFTEEYASSPSASLKKGKLVINIDWVRRMHRVDMDRFNGRYKVFELYD